MLSEANNVSIADIVIYTPYLLIAIYLSIRHGFGRNVGWLYLIIFSLARLIGAALQLATIADPTNVSLYIGSLTLQNIGLSPLILVQLGLLGRALASIRKSVNTFLDDRQLRLVQLLVVVGLILGAVGGSQTGTDFAKTGKYTPPAIAQAGLGLMIAGYAILIICTVIVGSQINAAEPGEKRVVLAIALSLPFILIRIVYAGESTFAANQKFNSLTGDLNIFVGMAVVMEMVVVAIVETIGLTLKKLPPGTRIGAANNSQGRRDQQYPMQGFENSRAAGVSQV